MKYSLRTLLALLTASLASAAVAQPVEIDVEATFENHSPKFGRRPLSVELRNPGTELKGSLSLWDGENESTYPIELPRGAQKQVTVYTNGGYDQSVLRFQSPRGIKLIQLPVPTAQVDRPLLLITDSPGELAFISHTPNKQGLTPFYCRPERLPDRSVAFDDFVGVILGNGSKRLTERQATALKRYALRGGMIIALGGPSAPVLEDPNWRDLLPVSNASPRMVDRTEILRQPGIPAAPPFAVQVGTPKLGSTVRSQGAIPLSVMRGFGLGKIVFLAFNPLERPLADWPGRRLATIRWVNFDQVSAASLGQPRDPSTTRYPVGSAAETPGGAFSLRLPPSGQIFAVLGIYFVLVVPVSFILLQRMRRGEWAWVTTPILALGASAILFSSAQELYRAQAAQQTVGEVVADASHPEALFVGRSDLFLPRSGVYDLKMQNVDHIGDDAEVGVPVVDVGEPRVPALFVKNLSFTRVNYRERLRLSGPIEIRKLHRNGAIKVMQIRNRSNWKIENGTLTSAKGSAPVGTLLPGASVEVNLRESKESTDRSLVGRSLRRTGGYILVGRLRGVEFGPRMGNRIDDASVVRLSMRLMEVGG